MIKKHRPAKRVEHRIPVYQLYGEKEQWPTPDLVHCESIADRSQLYDWEIRIHQHHGLFQLLYLRDGMARVVLDESEHGMQPGQLVLVPQMCVHGFRFDPAAQGHVVTVAYPLVDTLAAGLTAMDSRVLAPGIFTLTSPVDTYIEETFRQLDLEYRGNGLHRDKLMTALLQCIFVWISRQVSRLQSALSRPEDRGHRYFGQFAQLIERYYAKGWSIDRYAQHLGITPTYLNVLCREATGQSALTLIHQRLVLAAKRELVYTTMNVSVVAETLGFTDPAYFTRFFKRHVGVSPKEFRSQAASMMELT